MANGHRSSGPVIGSSPNVVVVVDGGTEVVVVSVPIVLTVASVVVVGGTVEVVVEPMTVVLTMVEVVVDDDVVVSGTVVVVELEVDVVELVEDVDDVVELVEVDDVVEDEVVVVSSVFSQHRITWLMSFPVEWT
jgi:hypothetical protein